MGFAVEPGAGLALPPGEAHHVRNVLRARPGDTVEVADREGRLFAAEVRDGAQLTVLSLLEADAGEEDVVLYQAVPKGRHMDLVVEKATEVGVSAIVPVQTEHGVVRPGGGEKVERWRRVAVAAARQSLRFRVPEIREPTGFREAVEGLVTPGVLLHNDGGLPTLEDAVGPGPLALFVGPEGGWSEGEISLALEAGVEAAQMGPYRLRSETAGIVAVARARAALAAGKRRKG